MLRKCVEKLVEQHSLSFEESYGAAIEMLKGENPPLSAAFLALLKAKGETVEELLGFVRAMRASGRSVKLDRPVLDIAGTGGDGAGTVNISTGSALLASACGIPVVKHGGRAVSSSSGSADVLEALGFNIHLTPEGLQESIRSTGFGYCFAPDYHPMMKEVRGVRQSLKIPTACNLLGPLLNPTGTDYMQIGVYRPELVKVLAEVLFRLGTKRSLVYHSQGLDELSCLGPADAILVTEKGMEPIRIDPQELGFAQCSLEELKGGDAETNARILKKALSGAPSAIADTLILNAGVALFLYGPAETIEKGVEIARERLYRPKKSLKNAILNSSPSAVIAEIKRASPSKGVIGVIADPVKRARLYVAGGAVAISTLTADAFQGTLVDLQVIARAFLKDSIPILRKDFIRTSAQIFETVLAGADAVLLIVADLKGRTREMLFEASEFGLEAIVEVHNKEELEIALAAGAEMIGVNQRDMRDFTLHPEVQAELIESIPTGIVKIAESGIASVHDARRVRCLGYDAILVGEALTCSLDPLSFLESLRGVYAR